VLIALVVAALGLSSLPTPLVSYREQGVLRRLSTTPLPPSWVLAAQLIINACLGASAIAADWGACQSVCVNDRGGHGVGMRPSK
jgi:ABC-2 type transport system permease protein